MALYLREVPDLNLRGLADALHDDSRTWGGVTTEMNVRLEDNVLSFGFGNHHVPATADGLDQLATFLGIPRAYLLRIDSDMRHYLLSEELRRNHGNLSIRFTDGGISEVYSPTSFRVEPRALVQSAINAFEEDFRVTDWAVNSDEVFFDIVAPENYDRGIGGDLQVGDITHGGVRILQDRKNSLAPTVTSFMFRLLCTNGMITPDRGSSIDLRGNTVEGVLAELELAAQRVFGQVEEQIGHFYELRGQVLEGDITGEVMRVAAEMGLPDRMASTLARRVPSELSADSLGHPPTRFDLANMFTNQANEPGVRGRASSRRALERAGGTLVMQHADRCGTCHQTI